MKRIRLNHVSTKAGARETEDAGPASFAKITKTTIRRSMTIVPKNATRRAIPNEEIIATTAMMPPMPRAHLTAGTALIAARRTDRGEAFVGSGSEEDRFSLLNWTYPIN
jgi:hypothetical protein